MGCGTGAKAVLLADLFPKCIVTGYDFSAEGINFAKIATILLTLLGIYLLSLLFSIIQNTLII